MLLKGKKDPAGGLNILIKISGCLVIIIPAITLLGWITGVPFLINIRSDYVPMAIPVCFFFVIYGLILVLDFNKLRGKLPKVLVFIFIGICSLYGLLQFIGNIVKTDLNFDYTLFPVTEKLGNFPIGHMSPYSGLLFFVSGIAIFLNVFVSDRAIIRNIAASIANIVALAGFVAGLGYLFGTPFLYSGSIIPLSLRTAISFFFLGFGIILMSGEKTIYLKLVTGPTAAARLLRLLIPVIVSVFLLEGILDVILTHIYKINEAVVLALLTCFSVILCIVVILNITREIFKSANKAEIERMKAQLELKELAEKLKESNDAKDKLFNIISHDLKSPFNSILGFVNILDEQYVEVSEDEKKSFILEIKKSAENTYDLINNLLAWSRTQTEGIKVIPSKFDLAEIVYQQVEILKNPANKKKINIINRIVPGTVVYADIDMVKTILLNLAGNAIKFTNECGTITFSAIVKLRETEVVVADNGVGISPSRAKNMFQLNEAQSTLGTSYETGTGLGLLICREFAERNNGRIWVESEPGKGSKFIFTLPHIH
jgi:signal transduction histidine kinase